MSVERINSQLKKVREQIAQLQAKEKDLAEQKQMAEDAEAMKIIRKYKISSERLQMLNKLSEDEVLILAVEKTIQSSPRRIQRRIPQKAQPRRHSLPQNAPARKNAVSMRWMRIVRCVQRITRNVLISIRA